MPPSVKRKPSCIDCKSTTRALNRPGPRCDTCWRVVVAKRKMTAHGLYVERTYGISAEEYRTIYEAQGGRCAICRRATGKSKKLAVDHDHKTNEVRGLLCSSCNYGVIGHLRDDVEALERAIEYLKNPPARDVLRVARCQPETQSS